MKESVIRYLYAGIPINLIPGYFNYKILRRRLQQGISSIKIKVFIDFLLQTEAHLIIDKIIINNTNIIDVYAGIYQWSGSYPAPYYGVEIGVAVL